MSAPSRKPKQAISPVLTAAFAIAVSFSAHAAIVEHDTLEVGVAPPDDALIERADGFNILGSDALLYDDNIYRLAPTITDLAALPGIGTNPRRADFIDTATLDINGQYSIGRQILVGQFRIDDNRYKDNTNLDYVSTADKLAWYWSAGDLLSGQVGTDYGRSLAGFVNAAVFSRDVISTEDYYATARYQVGPRWGLFAGVLEANSTLSEPSLKGNDNHSKSVDFGTEYAFAQNDIVGAEYRYTDTRFPTNAATNDDYREDNARAYVRYELSDKTSVDGSAGYLVRNYAQSNIDSFSGYTWRLAVRWKPTEKLLLELDGARNLSAYVTLESDYFVSTGGGGSVQWAPTDKITLAANFAAQEQNYVGLGPLAQSVNTVARRDVLTSAGVTLEYTPYRFLILGLGYTREQRGSNEVEFRYTDNITRAKFTVKY